MADPHPSPPGPLVLRGGGVTGVETDEMAAGVAALEALARDLDAVLHRVRAVPSAVVAGSGGPIVTVQVGGSADALLDERAGEAEAALRLVAARVERMRRAILSSARGYEDAEDAASAQMLGLTQTTARIVGTVAGGNLLEALFGAAAGAWLAWSLTPGTGEQKSARVKEWMLEHPGLVTSPGFVAVVRCIAASIDDLVAGGAGPAAVLLPHRRGPAGSSGVELGADEVLWAGGLAGLFRESGIRVRRVAAEEGVAPPTTISERLRRIPQDAGPTAHDQVVIEKYAAPGHPPHWVVYVDPTETFTPTPTSEPWDLTSNVDGVAGRSAASYRATEAAMTDAGIRPTDPVAFVGFSQGGLVAGMLAGSGNWNARGLETFGGPVGNIPLPDDLPGMQVRHTDDVVPALAGPDLPSRRLLVEQRAFPHGIPTNEAAPAHQEDSYARTAAAIDASTSPQVRSQLEAMRRFTADQAALPGATTERLTYRAVRDEQWRPATNEPLVPRAYAGRR